MKQGNQFYLEVQVFDENDNGEILEDGTIIEPYKTTLIYVGKQITTLEQCKELYEEIEVK